MRWTKPCHKTQTRTETIFTHMIRHMSKTRELTKNNAKAINWILTNKKFSSELKGQTDQGHKGFMSRVQKKKSSNICCCCLFTKSCLTLCHPVEPARLLCPWNFPDKNTGVGCHLLLQGIVPTQGSNPHLLLWRQIPYYLATREAQYLLH